jgi:hypothetical protein
VPSHLTDGIHPTASHQVAALLSRLGKLQRDIQGIRKQFSIEIPAALKHVIPDSKCHRDIFKNRLSIWAKINQPFPRFIIFASEDNKPWLTITSLHLDHAKHLIISWHSKGRKTKVM